MVVDQPWRTGCVATEDTKETSMLRQECRIPLLLGVLALMALTPATAQIPDEFTNLKLLDENIAKGELVATMRDWAGGLGVRCTHCHVGPDNLQDMDFATDEKPTKRAARRMLEMSRQINGSALAELPTVAEDGRERAQVVSCYTCHRGQPTPPRNLLQELSAAYRDGGIEAASAAYRELRAEHYGRGRYDFEKGPVQLATRLGEAQKTEDALSAIRLGLEFAPDSADLHATLGVTQLRAGRTDDAEKSLRRALELDPENATARWGMSRMEALEERARSREEGDGEH